MLMRLGLYVWLIKYVITLQKGLSAYGLQLMDTLAESLKLEIMDWIPLYTPYVIHFKAGPYDLNNLQIHQR